MFNIGFIRGIKFGIEYVDLDENDLEAFELDEDKSLMILIDLAFFRFLIFS